VAAAQAGVAAARAALQQAELALQDTYLRAPITGWVLARTIEVGSLAGNAGPGFSLIDARQVKAVFGVPDTALKMVQKGRTQKITIEALSHPVKGVVTAISPQADARSRVFSVEVTIPNPLDEMRPGMIGNLTIPEKQEATTRPVVPLSAVVRSPDKPGGYAVFSLERRGGKTYAVAKDITIGSMYGNSLEVIEGAAAGDPIVVMGAATIRNGEEVRVIGQEQGTDHGTQER
jgi:RND family efflux transporter MFP subunit